MIYTKLFRTDNPSVSLNGIESDTIGSYDIGFPCPYTASAVIGDSLTLEYHTSYRWGINFPLSVAYNSASQGANIEINGVNLLDAANVGTTIARINNTGGSYYQYDVSQYYTYYNLLLFPYSKASNQEEWVPGDKLTIYNMTPMFGMTIDGGGGASNNGWSLRINANNCAGGSSGTFPIYYPNYNSIGKWAYSDVVEMYKDDEYSYVKRNGNAIYSSARLWGMELYNSSNILINYKYNQLPNTNITFDAPSSNGSYKIKILGEDGQIIYQPLLIGSSTSTGKKKYGQLKQFYRDNDIFTGFLKPNEEDDPDYVPPFDSEECATGLITPTPSSSPSVTPTITPTVSPTSNNSDIIRILYSYSTLSDYSGVDFSENHPSFTVDDDAPAVLDFGANSLGYTFSPNWQWWNSGFTHATMRTYSQEEQRTWIDLPQSKKALGFNLDSEVFTRYPYPKYNDSVCGCLNSNEQCLCNPFYPNDVSGVISNHIADHFSWDVYNTDVDFISLDYEQSSFYIGYDYIIAKRNCLENGKYRSAVNGGTDPYYANISDGSWYYIYLNRDSEYWIDIINAMKNATNPSAKVSIYGVGPKNGGYVYSGLPESFLMDGSSETKWSISGNQGALRDKITYSSGQLYMGEPFNDLTESGVVNEMLALCETQKRSDPSKKSAIYIKPFRENVTGQESGNCTDCYHASSNQQISQGFAFIPFFTGNGFWLWGTVGKLEFGQSIDHFIAARYMCSKLNDIISGGTPIIPEISLDNNTFYGDSNDWYNATSPNNSTRYTAWVIDNYSGSGFPLIRGIKNGNKFGFCATRIGGDDSGSLDVWIRVSTSGSNFWKRKITLVGREWFIGRVNNISIA